jgi:hypothetical protein
MIAFAFTAGRSLHSPPTSVNLAIAVAIHCPRTCGLRSPPAKEPFLALVIMTSSQTFEILQQWHCMPDPSSYFLTQTGTAEENSALSASTSSFANVIFQDCKIAELCISTIWDFSSIIAALQLEPR